MPRTNMYGEEWEPPEALVNISPEILRRIVSSGILEFVEDASRTSIEEIVAWALDRTRTDVSPDFEEMLVMHGDQMEINLALTHLRTGDVGLWSFKIEELDERASYYEVVDFSRLF